MNMCSEVKYPWQMQIVKDKKQLHIFSQSVAPS